MAEVLTKHIIVAGRVQGVGFRWFTKDVAKQCHICGTVENLPDGTVEIYAQGNSEDLTRFETLIRKGPRFGFVSDFKIHTIETPTVYDSFTIKLGKHLRY